MRGWDEFYCFQKVRHRALFQDSRERPNLLVFDMSRAKGGAINLIAQQFGPDVTCVRFPFGIWEGGNGAGCTRL